MLIIWGLTGFAVRRDMSPCVVHVMFRGSEWFIEVDDIINEDGRNQNLMEEKGWMRVYSP